MNAKPEPLPPPRAGLSDSEAFPDLVAAAHRMLETGDALAAYRAFDEGTLAEVPHALETYMRHQRFDLN